MPKKPYFLSPEETFQKYERRSPVLTHSQYPDAPYMVERPPIATVPNQFVVTEYPNFEEKKKIPYACIAATAICVPVSIMIIMFLVNGITFFLQIYS